MRSVAWGVHTLRLCTKTQNLPGYVECFRKAPETCKLPGFKKKGQKTIKKSFELTRRRQFQITGVDFIAKFMRKQRKNTFSLHRKMAGIWWLGLLSRVKPREHFSGRHSKYLARRRLVSAILSFVSVLYGKEFTSGSKVIKKGKNQIL